MTVNIIYSVIWSELILKGLYTKYAQFFLLTMHASSSVNPPKMNLSRELLDYPKEVNYIFNIILFKKAWVSTTYKLPVARQKKLNLSLFK